MSIGVEGGGDLVQHDFLLSRKTENQRRPRTSRRIYEKTRRPQISADRHGSVEAIYNLGRQRPRIKLRGVPNRPGLYLQFLIRVFRAIRGCLNSSVSICVNPWRNFSFTSGTSSPP